MTNEQILTKAIEKAVKNGWKPTDLQGIDIDNLIFEVREYRVVWNFVLSNSLTKPLVESSVYGTIFSHDFAKAFWGEEIYDKGENPLALHYMWQYHIAVISLEPEPIKYLEKFI